MEDLNKTQVVLLTLFITFVTSVTTGIVTVTLLQQAPPAVTQTINRVVEKTIEKVTPGKTEIKQTTVLLRQEDEVISAAATLKPAIARIVIPNGTMIGNKDGGNGQMAETDSSTNNQAAVILNDSNTSEMTEIGTGVVVSSDGLVATSYAVIPDQNVNYGVVVGDKEYLASVTTYNKNDGIAVLKIEHEPGVKFFVPQFSATPVVLGQTVIVLGRDLGKYTISVGLVSSIKEVVAPALPSFKTTVKSDDTNIGGPLVNSAGTIIGINLSGGNALPIEIVKTYIASGNASTTKPLSY